MPGLMLDAGNGHEFQLLFLIQSPQSDGVFLVDFPFVHGLNEAEVAVFEKPEVCTLPRRNNVIIGTSNQNKLIQQKQIVTEHRRVG